MFRTLFLTACLLLSPVTGRSDWLNFRGVDGTAPTGPGANASIKWKIQLPGRGLGSPIIVGDRLFVSASSGPLQRRLHVLCFSAKTGEKLWERQLQATGRTMCHEKTAVAAPSMASDGQRVFALFSSNDLFAFDLDGSLLWLRGLTVAYPNASNSLGMASSPLVVGGVLVTPSENDSESFVAGLNLKNGRNIWKLERPKLANWTSPLAWQGNALLQSGKGMTSVDPATGSILFYSFFASLLQQVFDEVLPKPSLCSIHMVLVPQWCTVTVKQTHYKGKTNQLSQSYIATEGKVSTLL